MFRSTEMPYIRILLNYYCNSQVWERPECNTLAWSKHNSTLEWSMISVIQQWYYWYELSARGEILLHLTFLVMTKWQDTYMYMYILSWCKDFNEEQLSELQYDQCDTTAVVFVRKTGVQFTGMIITIHWNSHKYEKVILPDSKTRLCYLGCLTRPIALIHWI